MAFEGSDHGSLHIDRVLVALVAGGASPRQLGAVAAALGRVVASATAPPKSDDVRRRAVAVADALVVQEQLEAHGLPHRHRLAEAVADATAAGLLDADGYHAARRVVKRASVARHAAFPRRPPGVFLGATPEAEPHSDPGPGAF